ncbi:acyl carrier protein [Microvirga calopogonii]|uniref:acyl carrier protein n=1 Tax=Microvirga calopogonii TaxID=2078013 RepID=UPI000E0D7B8F|nr:acyl carrier protein [Microvirga calopogonii]
MSADQLTKEIIAKIENHVESAHWAISAVAISGSGEITAATELTSLGFDSLGLTDLIIDLERSYGIQIELAAAEASSNLRTIGDIVETVRGLLAKEA